MLAGKAHAGLRAETEFAALLARYLAGHQSLTTRDRECLAGAVRLMCLGQYDEAFRQVAQVPWPTEVSATTEPGIPTPRL